jgi:hypothetical protein
MAFFLFLHFVLFGMLLRYYLNDFEMVPAAPIITGITLLLFLLLLLQTVFQRIFGSWSRVLLAVQKSCARVSIISWRVGEKGGRTEIRTG